MAPDPLDQLRSHVEDRVGHRELECGRLLADHFASTLLPTEETVVYVNVEYNGQSGRSDLVVVAELTDLDGEEEVRQAYVWELKSPQSYVFEIENGSRARPSDALYAAENQLLHYHHEFATSESFRTRHGIAAPERVLIGGIVIGCDEMFVRSDAEARVAHVGMARLAQKVRKQVFYNNGLRLITWDTVLRLAP